MTAFVADEQEEASPGVSDRMSALGRLKFADGTFRAVTFAAAMVVLVILAGVIGSLFFGAWQAFSTFGFGFLTSDAWSAPKQNFGAAAAI